MTERTDSKLWEKIKKKITEGTKGGNAGQWSARKAQLAVSEYKKAGGGYLNKKDKNNSLTKWTNQNWKTKSGIPSLITGERYLPSKAINKLTNKQYQQTSEIKLKDIKEGHQFSKQPKKISDIVKKYR
jgi:hypothetical protein